MTFPTSLLTSAPPKSFYRPQPIATPIPASPQRPLPSESPPKPSAPLSSQDSFNASTLPACLSSPCGKTLLSRTTPRESSTPTSGRRGKQFGELPSSTPPGPFGDKASYFHSTSPSSTNSTLDSVIAGASRHLYGRFLREPPPPQTRKMRTTTVAQRKAEPLCKGRLPPSLTAFFSFRKSKNRNRTEHV